MAHPEQSSTPRTERRHLDRPRNGDTTACPHCGKGEIEFSERFRQDGGTVPAWLCDNPACTVRVAPVRRDAAVPPGAGGLAPASEEVRAETLRSIMKSRAGTARSKQRVASKNRPDNDS
jgi:hypothetical protein